ncbi:MAG: O-antigen ligase family protein [Candidatus Aureabacteria bacterium]|nr:O-antigen ligase family protein [Candidatus Auribacterota bacterium]
MGKTRGATPQGDDVLLLTLSILFGIVLVARVLWCGVLYPESNTFILLLLALLISAELIFCARMPAARPRFSMTDGCMLLYFLVLLSQSALRGHRWQGMDFLFQSAGCTAAYFLAKRLSVARRARIIISTALIAGAVIVSLYGLYQAFWGLGETRVMLGDLLKTRAGDSAFVSRAFSLAISSTFFFPNALAGYLVIVVPFVVSLLFWKREESQIAAIGCCLCTLAVASVAWGFFSDLYGKPLILVSLYAVIIVVVSGLKITGDRGSTPWMSVFCVPLCALPLWALSLTSSEGAWLSLGVCALLVPLFLLGKWRLACIVLLAMTAGASVMLCAGMIPFGLKDSLGARYDYWSAALRIWRENPLLGAGVGSFAGLYPRFRGPLSEEGRLAHSSYLGLGAETGLIGLGAFLCLWIFCLASLWRAARRREPVPFAVAVSIIVFLIHGAGDVDISVPGITMTLWTLAGLGTAVSLAGFPARRMSSLIGFPLGVAILFAAWSLVLPHARAEWHRLNASRAEGAGMGAVALEEISTAVSMESDNPSYWNVMGEMLERDGRTGKALEAYKKAAERGEGIAAYQFRLAACHWRASRGGADTMNARAAIVGIRKALVCNPYDVDYRLLLAYWHEKTGMKGRAVQEYREALGLLQNLCTAPKRIRRHTQENYQTLEKLVRGRVAALTQQEKPR